MLNTTFEKDPSPGKPSAGIQFPATTARKWVLPNGLTIIVQEDRSAPVASVQAWCETGSIDEGAHLGAGLSHILEHMLFKGTATRKNSEIAQKIQDAGGYINAYTSFDRTVYWIDVPAKGVPDALDILADAMMNSTLPGDEYEKEQEVIRREFAMGFDDPNRMQSQALFANAFSTSPLGTPIIGHLDVFNTLTRDDVMRYYKARYVPNNIFFVVAGDVSAEKVRDQLAKYFEAYPRKSLPPVYIPDEPQQLGRRESHSEFSTQLTRLSLAWHIPGVTSPDMPALDLLSSILGNGRSSILYRQLREKGLVNSISAYAYSAANTGLFGVDATLEAPRRMETERAVLAIIEDLKSNGVDPAELEKAKKQALSDQLQSLTTMRGIASDLGSNWLMVRNLNFTREYLAALQNVAPGDVKRVLNTWFGDRNLTVVSLNPAGSLAGGEAGAAPVSAGEIQKFTLPNGLRLLVREDKRLPLVSMVACFKAGLLAETPETNGITRLFARTVIKGTKSRTAGGISGELEAVGGSISADAGSNSVSISVDVTQPDLKLGLDILSDVLANATMPDDAITREKAAMFAAIKDEQDQPTAVARNLLRASLFPGHPFGLRASGTADSVAALTRRQLLDFQKQYIAGANGVIAVFGSVDAAEVRALVEKEFAKLPAGAPQLTNPPRPLPLEKNIIASQTVEKSQAILMYGYHGADILSPDRDALDLIHTASSDLGSRFFVRIREEMGAAYFVGASQAPGLVPGPFLFYAGTTPHQVAAVEPALLDEIQKLASGGLTAEELARAKEKMLGQQDIRNQSNDAFAASCALDELYGLGFDHYKSFRGAVEKLTLDDVKRVANKYFQNKPAVLVIVRPKPTS